VIPFEIGCADLHSPVYTAVTRLLEKAGEPGSGHRAVHLLLQFLLATWENADCSGYGPTLMLAYPINLLLFMCVPSLLVLGFHYRDRYRALRRE
jgi:hypothetical protein